MTPCRPRTDPAGPRSGGKSWLVWLASSLAGPAADTADAFARLRASRGTASRLFDKLRLVEANFSDRFLLSAWGTLSARMRPLLTETVVRSLAGADFSARELMCGTKPTTVYLRWPERDLLALSPLVRLLWGSLIDELITTYDADQGKECRPVLLLIDEAGRTAIPSLADHATTVVGRRISVWIAVQSLAQLDAMYGRARAHVLRDNVETQLYYRPANQETAEYLERCLGRKSGYAQSQTSHEGSTASEGLSEQSVPLLTAQEIKQLGMRTSSASTAGSRRFRPKGWTGGASVCWQSGGRCPLLGSSRREGPLAIG